jgi:hypothetical protein
MKIKAQAEQRNFELKYNNVFIRLQREQEIEYEKYIQNKMSNLKGPSKNVKILDELDESHKQDEYEK